MDSTGRKPLTATHWLVLIVAAIGFLFDTYELLMTPLAGVPAIADLLKLPPNHPAVTEWMGRMLWMTALCGGVFGLLGGWLIDRFGRKRMMAASIFIYALSPFAAAFSTNLGMFIFFRCTTFIGVCVEFVAAITWLAELFPDRQQKERALGWTQAAASLGGVLVTSVAAWINIQAVKSNTILPALPVPEIFNPHAAWRYLLMTGIIPAIPIALLLPFVPESQAWRERRQAGTLKRPSFAELFAPQLRRVTLTTAALSACAYAAAFGALQITTRSIVPGLAELKPQQGLLAPLRKQATLLNSNISVVKPRFEAALREVPGLEEIVGRRSTNRRALRQAVKSGDSNSVARISQEFSALTATLNQATTNALDARQAVLDRERYLKLLGDNRDAQEPHMGAILARGDKVQLAQETGGFAGRVLLAVLVMVAISRRALLRVFVVPGLLLLPLTYFSLYHQSAPAFTAGIFFCGLLVVGQFSYFGEYLPKAFPLHLRGTGGSFATNVGGRMIGTSAAVLTTNVVAPLLAGTAVVTANHYAMAAGIVGTSVFVIALLLSFVLPEPAMEGAE